MSIIADRGLFVRLPVQPGKFASADAEAFADAMDAATREPATKDDIIALRAEITALRIESKTEIADLRTNIAVLSQRIDAQTDRLLVRLGGLMFVPMSLLFAALRLT